VQSLCIGLHRFFNLEMICLYQISNKNESREASPSEAFEKRLPTHAITVFVVLQLILKVIAFSYSLNIFLSIAQ
jgi:hypothetical protein